MVLGLLNNGADLKLDDFALCGVGNIRFAWLGLGSIWIGCFILFYSISN